MELQKRNKESEESDQTIKVSVNRRKAEKGKIHGKAEKRMLQRKEESEA